MPPHYTRCSGARDAAHAALSLRFVYTPDLAPSSKERAAFLTFYASADVRSPSMPYVKLPLNDHVSEARGVVTLHLDADVIDAVPWDATVSVCAFVECENSHGEAAIDQVRKRTIMSVALKRSVQAGYARFYLEDLLSQKSDTLPLVVANANHYEKGRISLSIESAPPSVVFVRSDDDFRGEAQRQRALRTVEEHAELSQLPYSTFRPPPHYESMDAIRAPFYRHNDITMPGAAFALVRPDAPTPVEWYENVLDIVLRRQWPRIASAAEARAYLADESVHGAPWSEVACVLGKMLCVYVNYCVYLMDGVWEGRRRGLRSYLSSTKFEAIESFDCDLRTKNTGDCEDFSLESSLEAREIRDLPFTTPAMRRVQRVRRQYECEMLLFGVLGGALSDALRRGARFGGHMAARLTPRRLFDESMQRASTQRSIFVGGDATSSDGTPDWAEPTARAPLPTLSCEGTGMLEPTCDDDVTGPLHAYLASGAHEAAFDRLKYSVQQPREKEHTFYKSVQSSFCFDRLDAGYAVAEAAWLWKPLTSAAGSPLAASVPYPETLRPDASALSRWVITDFEAPAIRRLLPHLLKHVSPVPPHALPDAESLRKKSPLLDRLVRNNTTPVDLIDASWRAIDYVLRDDQVTETRVTALHAAFLDKPRCRRVEYFREAVTAERGGYLLRIWVAP